MEDSPNEEIFSDRPLITYYNDDKFESFGNEFSKRSSSNFIEICSTRENALAPKCLLIDRFNLGSDEKFHDSDAGRACAKAAAESTNGQIFFSYLMYDWYAPKSMIPQNYCLVLKNKQYFEVKQEHLIDRLLAIFVTSNEILYKQVVAKIIYQFVHEYNLARKDLEEFDSEPRKGSLKLVQEKLRNQVDIIDKNHKAAFIEKAARIVEKVSTGKKAFDESFENIFKVLLVFCLDETTKQSVDEKFENFSFSANFKEFLELVFLLKDKKTEEFQKSFNECMENARRNGDIESQTKLKMHNHLLMMIAESNELYKTSEYIFKACPDSGATIMSIWLDSNDFQRFYFEEPAEVKEIVSCIACIGTKIMKFAFRNDF
jgi:hypothetical protein